MRDIKLGDGGVIRAYLRLLEPEMVETRRDQMLDAPGFRWYPEYRFLINHPDSEMSIDAPGVRAMGIRSIAFIYGFIACDAYGAIEIKYRNYKVMHGHDRKRMSNFIKEHFYRKVWTLVGDYDERSGDQEVWKAECDKELYARRIVYGHTLDIAPRFYKEAGVKHRVAADTCIKRAGEWLNKNFLPRARRMTVDIEDIKAECKRLAKDECFFRNMFTPEDRIKGGE